MTAAAPPPCAVAFMAFDWSVCVCLKVDKIIEQLQHFIQSFDLFGLKEYWLYLDRRLFSRLEDVYRSTVNKLRTSLYRYYVINTIQVTHHPSPLPASGSK